MNFKKPQFSINLDDLKRPWIKVAYLLIKDLPAFEEIAKNPINEEFNSVVGQYVRAYVEKGVMPPADVAPTVLNLADDFIAGRQMTLKTGDYIALQTHMRNLKK